MRITRRPPTSIPGLGESVPAADTADTTAASERGTVTDRVQLSEAARLRNSLKTAIGDPSQSTSDRIQALQTEVANQTYAPSPRAIADRLLGELAADLLA